MGAVGELDLEHRCMSVQLATPKLGSILLIVLYGWVDDQMRTLALVDKVTKNIRKTGMPWAIMGDVNIPAKDMQVALSEGKSTAKVMAVGNTCFTKDGASAIDYGIVDRALAPWLWYGCTCSTALATHRPIQCCMKWQWNERIEVVVPRSKVPLDRIPGRAGGVVRHTRNGCGHYLQRAWP